MNPPARNAMWRFGYPNPVNYDDNELYCGGYAGNKYNFNIKVELDWIYNNLLHDENGVKYLIKHKIHFMILR